MGVTGLWTVLQPCARPIKIETLNRKRLAVDASIWIYQFLKAVRDKEGNALRNSHVVGFFRRICKLLFIGIKPVFVFDGGAPALKRQTISARKARREGRRDDAVRTAGKLLAVQMLRLAEEEKKKQTAATEDPDAIAPANPDEEEVPENPVYVDEIQMTAQERRQNRTFKKKDAYHLPDLDVSLSSMGAPDDPRIMSQEELEAYAKQFNTGEDISFYDFSKIDFDGPFFQSLPASDRYNILNAARLRSRLRMGYSKEQLDTMFPDRMAFSKFQIERVRERNELTQRLMNINGMNGELYGVGDGNRIAGERGREYVLVKNDGVEGGWALGVVTNKEEGQRNKPIDIDTYGQAPPPESSEDEWEDAEFEDVAIEGFNRLPKRKFDGPNDAFVTSNGQARRKKRKRTPVQEDPDSIFLAPAEEENPSADGDNASEDEDLEAAIAMSLEQEDATPKQAEKPSADQIKLMNAPAIDKPLQFNTRNAEVGQAYARITNERARKEGARGEEEPRTGVRAAYGLFDRQKTPEGQEKPLRESSPIKPPKHFFKGPLPFESIDLGQSLFTKRKKDKAPEPVKEDKVVEDAGGFEKPAEKEEEAAKPLPPWFTGAQAEEPKIESKKRADTSSVDPEQRDIETRRDSPILHRQRKGEVIELDRSYAEGEVIDLDSEDDTRRPTHMEIDVPPPVVSANEQAETTRAEPPVSAPAMQDNRDAEAGVEATAEVNIEAEEQDADEDIEWEESDREDRRPLKTREDVASKPAGGAVQPNEKSPSPDEFEEIDIPTTKTNQEPDEEQDADTYKHTVPALPRDDTFDKAPEVKIEDDEEYDFSDPEDADLMRQLADEAEEHARFAASIANGSVYQTAEDYEKELKQLRNQQKKDRRDADEVSHIMVTECQQLLRLFGLPYITAPMEAEAQCAELVRLGLVDGIVTDDSDIFLFGGTRVYKNMFNQAKYVECYLSADLEREYSLTREKICSIAHLLGSDYTEGLPNIGPVTALEILSEFETLEDFREWWTKVQSGMTVADDPAPSSFRKKFRRNATKLFLAPGFPDRRVDDAYLNPEVDSDDSAFAWGVPDLAALRSFLMATIGWSQDRADEILVPVIKDMNRRGVEGTQSNITQFITGSVGSGARARGLNDHGGQGGDSFAPRKRVEGSKRLGAALEKLHARAQGTADDGEGENADKEDGNGEEAPRSARKTRAKPAPAKKRTARKKATRKARKVSDEDEQDEAGDDEE